MILGQLRMRARQAKNAPLAAATTTSAILTIFDQVVRPSRLALGKKFFWIWFIYALEGIVLALQFFFDKVPHLKHPNVYVCIVDFLCFNHQCSLGLDVNGNFY